MTPLSRRASVRFSRSRWAAAVLFAASIWAAGAVSAAAPGGAAPTGRAPAGNVVVHNVTVHDGAGHVFPASQLWIKNARVDRIVPQATPAPAWPHTTRDGNGGVITPGFIELRTQVGLFEVSAEPTANDSVYEGHGETPALDVRDAFDDENSHIAIARDGGITALLSAPEGGLLSGRAAFVVLNAPGLASPRGDSAMMADVRVREPYGKNRAGVFLRLRELAALTASYKRAPKDYDAFSRSPRALSALSLEALVPVFSGAQLLIVSVDRASDIRALLRFVDERRAAGQKLRIVVASGAEAWQVADVLAKRRIPVILTPSAQDPGTFDTLSARDDAATLLHDAGVPLVISSSTWANNVRRLRHEAGLAVAHGLPREAAMAAITLTPAEIIGVGGARGSLEAGKSADFSIFDGDPLDVTSRPVAVYIEGREMPLATRQRALAEKYRHRREKDVP